MLRYSSATAPENWCVPKSSEEAIKWRRDTAAEATRERAEPREEAARRLAAETSMGAATSTIRVGQALIDCAGS